MQTTVDIPEAELEDVMRFTRAAGQAESIIPPDELQSLRRQG